MKVLLIDVTCKKGSTGRIVYDLYNHVNASGNEAAICYGRGPKVDEKNIFKFGLDWETYLHAFLTRITGWTGCFSYFSTKRLIKFVKRFKPDVVHIHELHAYFINIVSFLNFLKKLNIRVIHTLHCAFSYTGKCGHHLDCNRWMDSCGKCPRLKEYVSSFLFDNTKSMFCKKKKAFSGFKDMTIVCPSEWLANLARQSFLGQYQVEVVHNGIDTSVFAFKDSIDLKERLNINHKSRVILAVAPNLMNDSKGGKWVLKISDELKNKPFVFVMVGAKRPKGFDSNNVVFIEHIDDAYELSKYYSMSDVFLMLSQRESFSFTCAEALCCGTPILGFKCGAPETIFTEQCNAFFDYGDVNGLVEALLKGSDVDKESISNSANKKYGTETMCSTYMSLYDNKPVF